ncbi:FecR family protein [Filimonas lacunae]|uniref:FecR family protein n=1 Tax=Filimonas lacunae TaxID=477680 RepID=A0A173MDW4_9BACT|nr:FecR domain-containing protein [Filimonas lacunae]BAV05686.1 anti-sigma factor [Filimonas lacunae]SIT28903.1 FecR family protein [Filimonas lacunae]
MDKQIFIFLIDKFLSGRALPEEVEALANYYQSFQGKEEWNEEELGDVKEMELRLLDRLNAAIKKEDTTEEDTTTEITDELPAIAGSNRRRRYTVAASIVGVLVLGGLVFKNTIHNFLSPVKTISVATVKGSRKYIVLPDSSHVWLEGGSFFSYPEQFRGDERMVSLKGEAFFDVSKDMEHPFIIQTPLLTTKVLATSFNIEAYDSKSAEVVVVTGKVMVKEGGLDVQNDNAQQVVVRPNHKVSYDSTLKTLETKEAPEAADYLQRRDGRFIYKGAKVSDIIRDLQRAYNTPIAISKEMLNCTFYGDFNAKDDVEKALHLIALSLNGTVENKGVKGYFISGEGCN